MLVLYPNRLVFVHGDELVRVRAVLRAGRHLEAVLGGFGFGHIGEFNVHCFMVMENACLNIYIAISGVERRLLAV